MSLYLKRQDFSPSCPAGGSWYTCADSKFVGCCTSDPCKNDCPDGNLRPASFPKEQYGKYPDASCSAGSRFYTCTNTPGGPFWGCCKSNPCQSGVGCPDGDLTGAFADKPKQVEFYSLTGSAMSSSTTTSASSKTATLETRTTTTSAAEQVTVTASPAPAAKPIAAIAGGAAGGGVGLAIIIGLLIYYICHAKRSRQGHNDEVERRLSAKAAAKSNPAAENKDAPLSPPPTYFSPDAISQHGAASPASSRTYHHEMPGAALSPTPSHIARKDNGRHRLSELSGDTARRSELDGQWGPRHPNSWSPPDTPHSTRQFPTHSRDASGTVQLLATWEEDPGTYAHTRQPSSVYATSPQTSPVYDQPSQISPVYTQPSHMSPVYAPSSHVSPVYAQAAHSSPTYTQGGPQSAHDAAHDPTAHPPPSQHPPTAAYAAEAWTTQPSAAHPAHPPRQDSRTFRAPERTAQWVDSHTSPYPDHEHAPEAWPEYDEHAGFRGTQSHIATLPSQQQQQNVHAQWPPAGQRDNVRGYPGV